MKCIFTDSDGDTMMFNGNDVFGSVWVRMSSRDGFVIESMEQFDDMVRRMKIIADEVWGIESDEHEDNASSGDIEVPKALDALLNNEAVIDAVVDRIFERITERCTFDGINDSVTEVDCDKIESKLDDGGDGDVKTVFYSKYGTKLQVGDHSGIVYIRVADQFTTFIENDDVDELIDALKHTKRSIQRKNKGK